MTRRWPWRDGAAVIALALFAVALYAPLLLTNRVVAEGDILHYFYPYRDYAAAAVREGVIPLWNPYSFMGVPFMANPQAAVFYPLHWPLSWLSVTQQIAWSAALHTWLLGVGGYLLVRRWGLGRIAALGTGIILSGSGFVGGLLGHINQLNGAAWLPWALWALSAAPSIPNREWAAWGRSAGAFGLFVALMFLAGHTQTVYINLFGVGVWLVWPLVAVMGRPIIRRVLPRFATVDAPPLGSTARVVGAQLAAYAVGGAVALAAVAPQLLPTLELSDLGLRQGGLSYAEASSFSLKPLHLGWTLLPSYGVADLGVVFATLGYTEYVAYVGVGGLLLAAWAVWRGRGPVRAVGLLLAVVGFLLALGRWNPVYLLLYWLVPGFDLFRAPARWMMLYTLGMALLAAPALQALSQRRRLALAVCALLALELWLAGRALPQAHPTAPQAVYEVRTAPAHLRTDPARDALHPAAAGRFLSMSAIAFDPGDMADYARVLTQGDRPQLDARAFAQFVVALKAQEILAPNLALLHRIPALDGFDGGVLPLARYLDLLTLFVPREQLVSDGRLREQVTRVPDTRLLGMLHVQYVITDKVHDLWFEGIYYDRQLGATLDANRPTLTVEPSPAFPATELHLIATLEAELPADADNRTVLQVTLEGPLGAQTVSLMAGAQAGAHLGGARLDDPAAANSGATVATRDVEGGRQEYRVVIDLAAVGSPHAITLVAAADAPPVTVQAATLVDTRTGMFTPLLPSDRGRFHRVHSGDVKVYENLDLLPRARLVYRTLPVDDPAAALAVVADATFDPAQVAVVEADLALDASPASTGDAEIVLYSPERIVIRTTSDAAALLVLADADYPGWTATVDGAPAEIVRTNVLLRGVAVPPGEHDVEMRYRPSHWPQALWFGALGWLGLALLWLAPSVGRLLRARSRPGV